MLMRIGCFIVPAMALAALCHGQDVSRYQPMKSHSHRSEALIEALRFQLTRELWDLKDSDKFSVVKKINEERVELIVNMVKRGVFIQDDSLESYVNTVVADLAESNGFPADHRIVLVMDSPIVNAYCFGQGIYIVTVSLLGRISSEHELAFTLAHELAHDELDHIKKRIVQEAEISIAKKSREQIRRILSGTVQLKDIEEYRKLIYGVSRYSRQKEMQADSMAMILLQNAGYDQFESVSMLTALDESLKPKIDIGVDLFWPLNAEAYPLQDYWFNKRLSIYSRRHGDSYLYSADSVETHPDITLRKEAVRANRRPDAPVLEHQPAEFVQAVTLLSEFETVQSAYEHRMFDRALYYALQLLHRYPDNPFLVSRIGRILVTLYEAKNNSDNSFQLFVPQFTSYYSEELTLINNMLHNLTAKELGEMTYFFLSNPTRFNVGEKSHCFLLWKICDLTYRKEKANELKKLFKDKFELNIAAYTYK